MQMLRDGRRGQSKVDFIFQLYNIMFYFLIDLSKQPASCYQLLSLFDFTATLKIITRSHCPIL